jgi:L-asparaginase
LKTQSRPAIVLIATGGTIASIADDDADGAVPALTARDLVENVPGLSEHADIECVQHAQKPSVELDIPDLVSLLATCREAVAAGAAGLVIAQGTDTMEETSYVLDLLWDRPEPIVVTGAMRNPSLAGSDGPANLLAATQVAVSPSARDRGVLVVLNDEIHAARDVVKTHTSSTSAFRSWRTGAIGVVHEGETRFNASPSRQPPLDVDLVSVPPIALVTVTLGDDIPYLETLPAWGYRGLVIQAFGGGHVRSKLVPAIRALSQRIPVVLASRTGSGAILTHTYGFPGSEKDLLEAGVIPAGSLHPLKARLLLSMLIATGADSVTVRSQFLARA